MAVHRRRTRLALLTVAVFLFLYYANLIPSPFSNEPSRPPVDTTVKATSEDEIIPAAAKPANRFKSGNSFDWSTFDPYYPPGSLKPLPSGPPLALPPVQAPGPEFKQSSTSDKRREAVRKAFKRTWDSYRQNAWMKDELMPLSGQSKNTFGGWAATLVDSLDTLWIMDFKDEFKEAAKAASTLDWSKTNDGAANMFETTIRHLGGLLSAYDLSGDEILLQKAHELGEMLYVGFDTPNRLPGFWLNFNDARNGQQFAGTHDPSASPASLSLEFTRLSQLTGDPKFYDATDRVTRFLEKVQNTTELPGMWPIALDFKNEAAPDTTFTLGALADSLYEYLPKMYALLGGLDDSYQTLYRTAMDTVTKNLLFRPMTPNEDDILFTGDVKVVKGNPRLIPESQHLTCFVGGMFGLGGKLFEIDDHVSIGERLARGCGWAYKSFPAGVMPEIFQLIMCDSMSECKWNQEMWDNEGARRLPKGFMGARDAKYILRPEAIESIFLLYRMTGKADLQDLAWDMFQAVTKLTETPLANAAVKDITQEKPELVDSMESFWTAETLKYFYLIFSPPDLVSLDDYVFNTEAHPLKRPKAA
ncbi:glycosyl hydrolase family 47 domain-containing protein [Sarocladium implicatum]|nr:glycosyl hydrolase family 47 domain-containing protein [Sarocladium implicatum]